MKECFIQRTYAHIASYIFILAPIKLSTLDVSTVRRRRQTNQQTKKKTEYLKFKTVNIAGEKK